MCGTRVDQGEEICTQSRQAPSRGLRAKKRECVCLLKLDTLLFLLPVDITAPVPPAFIVQDLLCGLGLRVNYTLCSLGLEASGLHRESSLQTAYKLILSPWLFYLHDCNVHYLPLLYLHVCLPSVLSAHWTFLHPWSISSSTYMLYWAIPQKLPGLVLVSRVSASEMLREKWRGTGQTSTLLS